MITCELEMRGGSFFSICFSFYAIFNETAALRYPLSSCGALDISDQIFLQYFEYTESFTAI